ncbi:helix-turn-helix domain-containing protein [Lysinibacillus fusiformis]|uniref:helix-turn-helix domain-containing protein n=1 Tax=Lysinibacillus fusiformis TaxID=28031 RepID=UPI0023A92B0C|nr:helix-turn-helix domain-containing protein [Lysinibacillus fusiformis]WEA41758.1 helix-turn-helix domain-containing protein [Lysinibacillus fusiformis]
MNFGERLRFLRKELDYSLRKMADELGISFSALGKYERNEHQPDFETLEKIADYFDVSIDWLLGRTQGYEHAIRLIDSAVERMNLEVDLNIPPALLNEMILKNIDESQLSLIPVYGTSNGMLNLSEANIIEYEFKHNQDMPEESFFYIISPDDSMKGSNIVKDSKVLCRRLDMIDIKNLDIGKIYLVSYQNSLYVRRVFVNNQDQITLQAENNQFPPIIINNMSDINIIGHVQSVEFNPNKQ